MWGYLRILCAWLGVPQDHAEAAQLYQLAAARGKSSHGWFTVVFTQLLRPSPVVFTDNRERVTVSVADRQPQVNLQGGHPTGHPERP